MVSVHPLILGLMLRAVELMRVYFHPGQDAEASGIGVAAEANALPARTWAPVGRL